MKHSDYLGLHLNNRFAYLQYQNVRTRQSSPLDQSNKYLLLIIFSILTIILIAITLLFVSLIRRKTFREKKELLNREKSKTMIMMMNNQAPKTNLRVTNCCDFNDASLLMLNKDLFNASTITNDHCCLLETISEKEIYDHQKNQVGNIRWLSGVEWDICCLDLFIMGIINSTRYIDLSFIESSLIKSVGMYGLRGLASDENIFGYTCEFRWWILWIIGYLRPFNCWWTSLSFIFFVSIDVQTPVGDQWNWLNSTCSIQSHTQRAGNWFIQSYSPTIRTDLSQSQESFR